MPLTGRAGTWALVLGLLILAAITYFALAAPTAH